MDSRVPSFYVASILLSVCVAQYTVAQSRFLYTVDGVEFSKFSYDNVSGTPNFRVSADLNGDGSLDVVLFGGTDPSESASGAKQGIILFNNGDNTFTRAVGDSPASENARELLVADFNGDTILDLYIADHGWDAAPFPGFRDQLLLGTGTGFVDETARIPAVAGFTHNGGAGDIDGDGDIDILALNADQLADELSYLLINDGNANFEMNRSLLPLSLGTLASLKPSYGAELADLNNDGRAELIVGRANFSGSRETSIYWNDGSGQFSDNDVTELPAVNLFGSLDNLAVIDIRGVDIDNNGLTDVFVSAYSASFNGISMQLFMNKGNRVFQDEAVKRLGALVQDGAANRAVPYQLQFLDVTGDGIIDIVPNIQGDTSSTSLLLLEGRGQGCFTPVISQTLTSDTEALFRLGNLPVYSDAGLEYMEVFGSGENQQRQFVFNTVPVQITALPPVANSFDSCSGLLKTTVDAGTFGLVKLDFVITQDSPDILVQALPDSVTTQSSVIDKMGLFDGVTGMLTLPELLLDGTVAARNLVFSLVDESQLIFKLESFE